jgi:hypothetical protein
MQTMPLAFSLKRHEQVYVPQKAKFVNGHILVGQAVSPAIFFPRAHRAGAVAKCRPASSAAARKATPEAMKKRAENGPLLVVK